MCWQSGFATVFERNIKEPDFDFRFTNLDLRIHVLLIEIYLEFVILDLEFYHLKLL